MNSKLAMAIADAEKMGDNYPQYLIATMQQIVDDPSSPYNTADMQSVAVRALSEYTLPSNFVQHIRTLERDGQDTLMGILYNACTTNAERLLLCVTAPTVSKTVANRVAYYRSADMVCADTRTPIKIRKYLTKYNFGCNQADPAEWREQVAKRVDNFFASIAELDIRFSDTADADGWREAYTSPKIKSCMQAFYGSDGVAQYETYRSYLLKHYGFADEYAVQLAVLYQDGVAVGRAITFTDEQGKPCYVRAYGDGRLAEWLNLSGFEKVDAYPLGFKLVAVWDDGDNVHTCPYLDGSNQNVDVDGVFADGVHKLMYVSECGEFELSNTKGVVNDTTEYIVCECCGGDTDADYSVWAMDAGLHNIRICEHCADYNRITANQGIVGHELVIVETDADAMYDNDFIPHYSDSEQWYLRETIEQAGGHDFVIVDTDDGERVTERCNTTAELITGELKLTEQLDDIDYSTYPTVKQAMATNAGVAERVTQTLKLFADYLAVDELDNTLVDAWELGGDNNFTRIEYLTDLLYDGYYSTMAWYIPSEYTTDAIDCYPRSTTVTRQDWLATDLVRMERYSRSGSAEKVLLPVFTDEFLQHFGDTPRVLATLSECKRAIVEHGLELDTAWRWDDQQEEWVRFLYTELAELR